MLIVKKIIKAQIWRATQRPLKRRDPAIIDSMSPNRYYGMYVCHHRYGMVAQNL